jgi:hypothetical protein
MPLDQVSLAADLSRSEKQQVMSTHVFARCSTTTQNLACSLRRKRNDTEANHNSEESPTGPETSLPSTRLRKRARISYAEPTESDIESDPDSGYNSDSSVEWGSHAKQTKTKHSRKERPVKPFPFLALPSELRNKVYSLALEDPNGIVMGEGWRAHRRVPKRWHTHNFDADRYAGLDNLHRSSSGIRKAYTPLTLVPSLLAVNKQIYAEAAAILYSQPLHFTCTTALHSFLAALSMQTASLVSSITIHHYETWGRGVRKAMNVSALTLLSKCGNLQLLRIEGFDSYHNRHHQRYWHTHHSPTQQERGDYEGKCVARQMYRDAAFWFDSIGIEKTLQVLEISGLQRKTKSDDAKEVLRISNQVFVEELTLLVRGMGRNVKKGRKAKTARASG